MPGFLISGSEFGKGNLSEVRRKHRWFFSTLGTTQITTEALLWLKSATKPEIEILPLEMHFEQERAWQAGKHQWNDIELVWYDAEQPDISSVVYEWLNETLNIDRATMATPATYKRDGQLEHQSSSMKSPDVWRLYNIWPTRVNWDSLDYSDSNFLEVKVTLKYDRATFKPGNKPGSLLLE